MISAGTVRVERTDGGVTPAEIIKLKAHRRRAKRDAMIDNFSLLVSHGLVLLACWRLLSRPDLDQERTESDRKDQRGA